MVVVVVMSNGCADDPDDPVSDCVEAMDVYYQVGCSIPLPPSVHPGNGPVSQPEATDYCIALRMEGGDACRADRENWLTCAAAADGCGCVDLQHAFETCAAAQAR